MQRTFDCNGNRWSVCQCGTKTGGSDNKNPVSPEFKDCKFTADKNWQTASESKPYKEPELQTTPKETIIQNIKNIITEIKGDTQ